MALAEASSYGVTSIQDNSEEYPFRLYEEFRDGRSRNGKSVPPAPALVDLPILSRLHAKGKLPLRITEWLPFNAPFACSKNSGTHFRNSRRVDQDRHAEGFPRWLARFAHRGDARALFGRGFDLGNSPCRSGPVKQMAIARDAAGFQIAFHAIGDRANRLALDTFAAIREANGARDRRDRVEHAQILALDDIPRFAALGVIASMQPCHLLDDERWAESRIGSERIKGGYAWNSLEKSGAHLAFGTDYPVESVNPLRGLYACATRELPAAAQPAAGSRRKSCPIETCIREYTAGAAYAEFEGNREKASWCQECSPTS